MRKRCLDVVYRLAKSNRDVVFIGSDLGVGVLDNFKRELPGQWFMEGVSEQHIIGMAAGLAMSGKTVYFNTIATFISRRCYEQNAVDLGLAKLKVRLLGSGGGCVYAPLGPTHLATEDIALMRAIPNMTIVAPCDAEEMERAMLASENHEGPIYVRIAKGGDSVVSKAELGFEIGRAVDYQEPGEVLFVTTGIMLQRAIDAAAILAKTGISAGIVHCHTVKPFDSKTVVAAARKARAVLSLEEHTVLGGLGSAVAEALSEAPFEKAPRFKRLGLPDVYPDEYGSQNSLLDRYGLSAEKIAAEGQWLLSQRLTGVRGG
ncbi:MAG: transketolase [Elusimicrobia bacterium]|nr:transketolase [Elusimicrobiota bacterium]